MLSCASLVSAGYAPAISPPPSSRRHTAAKLSDATAPPKVVVTGISALTSLSSDCSAHTFFDNLIAGKCGIGPLTRFDTTNHAVKIGAQIHDFDVEANGAWTAKEAKRYDRHIHYAMAASKAALDDAALDAATVDPKRFGVLVGTGAGGMEAVETATKTLYEKGEKRITPFLLPSIILNTATSMVAMKLGAMGPNYGIVSACATATHALGEALQKIQQGEADVMLAGGCEATLTPLTISGFTSMRAMCTTSNDSPQTASRPFDASRAGFVMGEGAGVLVLESEAHAIARGATIYCELGGYAATCDAHHITSPHPEGEGMRDCLTKAMAAAGVGPEHIGYVNAHGTSTPLNDKFETMAYKRAFGAHAPHIKISSTKGATGPLLGAAGGVEAAVACKVLQTGSVPPTLNLHDPDPECDLDYVPNVAQTLDAPPVAAISDNLGFGGHNAALVFKQYAPA